jgi:beta-galactosidase
MRFELRLLLVAASLLAQSVALPAQPREVHPVRRGPAVVGLNGTWQFLHVPGSAGVPDELLSGGPAADAVPWGKIVVPGHWELQGYGEPQYGKRAAEATGVYRRRVAVPDTWRGQRIFLHFEGVLFGFDVWVNGRRLGEWNSGYNPSSFDVTDVVQPGTEATVSVRVGTRTRGYEFDTNDCWALSGIYRDVRLFAVPAVHLVDLETRTRVDAGGDATLAVAVRLSGDGTVRGRLLDPRGGVLGELSFDTAPASTARAELALRHPALWTAETPSLHTLELVLSSGQVVRERIGLRQVSVADGVLRLNGRPIKLRGVNHHDLWPLTGRTATEEAMRRDLELMRDANVNFVRTSHYPPHPRFLELCDELGFYVMDEVPFGFGEEHLDDPAFGPDLLARAEATVRRDRNRPSVIVWSIGNENPNTPLTFATARRVKALDPTRPVCFPQIGSYFAKSHGDLPEDIDLYAPHYPSTETVRDYGARLTRPIIFTEYAHALGLATDQVQTQWELMQASPRIAGGAVWMFQDQGILRPAAGQAPSSTRKLSLATWPDPLRYYDPSGNAGMDGLVYADRTPQEDYWLVRKVYSPVRLGLDTGGFRPGPNRAVLRVANRYDFRSLQGLTLSWSVRRNGAVLATAAVPLRAPAGEVEEVGLEVVLPDGAGADVFTLEAFVSEAGRPAIHERSFRLATLGAGVDRVVEAAREAGRGDLRLEETEAEFRVRHPRLTVVLARTTGEFALRDGEGRVLAEGLSPHVGRRFTEAESMRAGKERPWPGGFLAAAPGLATTATRGPDSVTLGVRGRFLRPDVPTQAFEGGLTVVVRADGSLDVDYAFTPVGGSGLLLQAGLGLRVAAEATQFRWLGDGPFAGYPGKDVLNEYARHHLGRDDLRFQGNRRRVELALLTRPDTTGLAIGGREMDVSVERHEGFTLLAHNAVLSGRGTKFAAPDTMVVAEGSPTVAGRFALVPLGALWTPAWTRWFGDPSASVPVQRPYWHSYDQ